MQTLQGHFPVGVSDLFASLATGWTPRNDAKEFWLDPYKGTDNNSDGAYTKPFKTLARAYGVMKPRSGKGDKLHVMSYYDPTTGASSGGFVRLTDTATGAADDYGLIASAGAGAVWDVDACQIIGECAAGTNPRASIRLGATDVATANMLTVSADGCYFENIGFYHGSALASAQIALTVSGGHNLFVGCDAMGGGAAAAANAAGSRSLKVTGSENRWVGGRIGLTTVPRTAAMAELELAGHAARNMFEHVLFESYHAVAGGDGCTFVLIAAGGIDRYVRFNYCGFENSSDSAGRAMTQAFSLTGALGGHVILRGTQARGVTKLESTASNLVYVDGVGGGATGGLMVLNSG